jgi:exopolysaccharide biosynthesis polyprenyl glycosylphosphotransferase
LIKTGGVTIEQPNIGADFVAGLEGIPGLIRKRPTALTQRHLSSQTQWRLFILGLLANDFIMLGLAFGWAYWLRFELSFPVFQLDVNPDFGFYFRIGLALIPIWLVVFGLAGLYNRQKLLGGVQEYALVFRMTTTALLLVIIAGFLEPVFIIARGWLLLAWGLSFLLTAFGRFWLRRLVYSLRRKGYFLTPAVIVGANDEGSSLAEQLLSWKTSGLHLVGVVDNQATSETFAVHDLPVLGTLDMLEEIVVKHQIEEVILAHSALSRAEVIAIFKHYGFSNKVNLRLSSGLFEIITTGLEIKEFADVPLVKVQKVRLTGIDNVLKFMLDYGLAIPGVILALPLLILIAIVIKLDSPGPVFHRRRVMGVNSRQFDAFKFRTMYVNGDEILAAYPELQARLAKQHKLKNDPRVTRVGHLLRSFSLDELPQIFNVLLNEMSLVGPRMISPAEMDMYNHWAINLLTVRPGITGLWQVSGRSDIPYKARVRLDMHYIRNWTIWLDLHLLLRTIPAIIKRRGAY